MINNTDSLFFIVCAQYENKWKEQTLYIITTANPTACPRMIFNCLEKLQE